MWMIARYKQGLVSRTQTLKLWQDSSSRTHSFKEQSVLKRGHNFGHRKESEKAYKILIVGSQSATLKCKVHFVSHAQRLPYVRSGQETTAWRA